jgi:hypothetical protein
VEEVLEVEDFKPTSQNRSVGVAVSHSSSNHSDKSSKVVEKLQFEISNLNHNRVMKKSSF